MRSKVRALVVVVVLGLTVVPTASAGIRSGDAPNFDGERIVRVVKKFLRAIGIVSNSEQISIPRP